VVVVDCIFAPFVQESLQNWISHNSLETRNIRSILHQILLLLAYLHSVPL
jgi:hypothetical protein